MASAIETRRFDAPDQHLDMKDAGGIRIVQLKGGASGMHAVFEPGWTWEKDAGRFSSAVKCASHAKK